MLAWLLAEHAESLDTAVKQLTAEFKEAEAGLCKRIDEAGRSVEATAERVAAQRAGAKVDKAISELKEQMQAWQLISADLGPAVSGMIILASRVRGQDIVRIVRIPTETTMAFWQSMVADIETRYGARPTFVDARRDFCEALIRSR